MLGVKRWMRDNKTDTDSQRRANKRRTQQNVDEQKKKESQYGDDVWDTRRYDRILFCSST